jgi:hypothetical protein
MSQLKPDALIRTLRADAPASGAELCARLGGIDKSTLSRALRRLGEAVISRGGSKRTRYALRRPLRGQTEALPLYRIDQAGQGHLLAWLDPYFPGGCGLEFVEPASAFSWPLPEKMRDGWFEGVPYPLFDMRPQGFLGRHLARRHAVDLQVQEDPKQWSDDDLLHVLAQRGEDLPGNLILGEPAYRRFLAAQRTRHWLADDELADAYPALAREALLHGDAGSSAGGEFPKFIAHRKSSGEPWTAIVKFSADDLARIERLWCFGKLIANTDMHEGNLAFVPQPGGFMLAPAYDMLPMLYAPLRGGEVPPREFSPESPLPSDRKAWQSVVGAAIHFWQACASEARLSPAFARICAANADQLSTVRQ